MDNSDKTTLVTAVEPPPYTEQPAHTFQPGYQPQPGYPAPQPGYPAPQPGYPAPQPGYPAHPGYQPQPGYPAQPGYHPQPGYRAQPGQQTQSGYPPQYGYPPPQQPGYAPQSMQQVQQNTTVVNVGAPPTVIMGLNPYPPSWLGLSIFTFLCCPAWPIGIAAIIFSCMVDSSYGAGDYEGAWRNSNIAKWLNIASIVCGIAVGIIFITIVINAS